MAKDLVLVGVLGAPHGVRGELRLKSFTEDPAAAGDYGPVRTEDGRSFDLTVVRPLKDDMVVARIAGIDDRDAAAALTHLRLFVPRERLPQPDEDEFYSSDLVGLAVVDREGQPLGTVSAVVDYGAGDLLEVVPPGGGAGILLPFTKAFVPGVDLVAGRLVADPPAGLFDGEASPADDGSAGQPGAAPVDKPVPPPPPPAAGPGGRRKGGRW